ncbi:MAG: hydrolase [Cytophagales bacterium CG12_big_fil_rev_8_21_14_0_65_40_12]|nr:MAG: hydrolase [Cytophagales bacterium CG12_big_fil_rev_8_21_14_0_65_40_12]PIW06292.1 MAG: hydrolase [Cytophagales bacterium CG17_big_fil_post_rev_8_21_14_2_50_40_13]
MRKVFLALFLLFVGLSLVSQSVEIRRTTTPVVIDGVIESTWAMADSAYNFQQFFPFDSSLAVAQSVARLLYDDEFIYVSGVMKNPAGARKYITPSLRRDFRGEANDSFSVIFDAFQDNTNGILFGVNPFGVRREGLISNGGSGENGFSLDWDNKWFGEAKQYDGYWVVEMAIPFKTLRFTANQRQWNVNFYRIDSEYAERSTWSPISRNFSIVNLASMRKMNWDEPTKKTSSNISFIPYVSAGTTTNFEQRDLSEDNVNAGFDLKYAVTSGLNLDLTVNPDFSQVEVDQQVTNLDRFEIFFPERRQFFLENADLFSNYGNRNTRPFFSRRIGIARDENTGQNIQNPIPVGARLSGKVNDDLRLGFLSMQAGRDESIGLPSYNFSMLTLQQKVFSRSNVSFLLVNKQTFENANTYDFANYNEWNRTLGVDYNLASANNVWNGKLFYHQSIDEIQPDKAFATGLELSYGVPKFSANIFSQAVGANYNPEVGFVRRRDIRQLAGTARYSFFPVAGEIQRHGPGFDFDMLGNSEFGFLDWDVNLLYDVFWKSSANFSLRLRRQYTYLFDGFDPSGAGGLALPSGTDYITHLLVASYTSDQRKKFFYELSTRSGEYFNGTRINLEGSFSFRYQPLGFTSIDFAYNKIRLPEPYTDANLILVGPRFDFTFTKKLFWTTFVQYNSQIDNLNINSRLQWRFAPVSDFFLVYTDNYLATDEGGFINIGQSKVRAIVFKMTYWLNL